MTNKAKPKSVHRLASIAHQVRWYALWIAVCSTGALLMLTVLWSCRVFTLMQDSAISTYLYGDNASECFPIRFGWGLPLTKWGRIAWALAVLAVSSIALLTVLLLARLPRMEYQGASMTKNSTTGTIRRFALQIATSLRRYAPWVAGVSTGILVVLFILWSCGAFTVLQDDYINAVWHRNSASACYSLRNSTGLPLTVWGRTAWTLASLAIASTTLLVALLLARLPKKG